MLHMLIPNVPTSDREQAEFSISVSAPINEPNQLEHDTKQDHLR